MPTKVLTDFEEMEKKITDFEQNYLKIKEQANKAQELEEKLNAFEAKFSDDEVIAAQLQDLHSQIEQYEKTNRELNEANSRLQNALSTIQEDNIKLEDELNNIKSEHGNVKELKSKLAVLEETVITQQKELVEKDKILKGKREGPTESALQKFIVGKVETIKEFNRLIETAKFRLFLIVPKIEDLEQFNRKKSEKINIRIATAFDLTNNAHKTILTSYPNTDFRNYAGMDRWGIERDAEEICIVAESENKDYVGISSSDSKICELFSKLLTEAWLKGTKVTL